MSLIKAAFESFLTDATYRQIEQASVFNDLAAILAIIGNRSRAGWVIDDKGICPLGCAACDKGFWLLRQANEIPVIAPVPGYPREKNCVRCRFFLTGPAFLAGLQDHFNFVSSQLSDSSERYVKFQQQVEAFEDERENCAEDGRPFKQAAEYEKVSRAYEIEAEKCNKLGEDLNATLKLIKRSITIKQTPDIEDDGKLSLVPNGGIEDVQFALSEVSETHQIEVLCENATFYPEADASKSVLRRSQILDACLEMNGRAPVFFKLSTELQHEIGNEFMRMLKATQGSIKGAVDVVEGMKSLQEIGLLEQTTELLQYRTGLPLLPNGTIQVDQFSIGTGVG